MNSKRALPTSDTTPPLQSSTTIIRVKEQSVSSKIEPSGQATKENEAHVSPHTDHYQYCWEGYRQSGRPKLDVLRLGALCGASNGLLAAGPAFSGKLIDEASQTTQALLAKCVRVVAAVDDGAVEVELASDGNSLATCDLEGQGWCPKNGPLCQPFPRPLEVIIRTISAKAPPAFAAQLWKR